MRATLSIALSVAVAVGVMICPLWTSAAAASPHSCCSKTGKPGSHCPVSICELSAPYVTEGKADVAPPQILDTAIDAAPTLVTLPSMPAERVEFAPLRAHPPDLPIVLHVILI